MTQFRIVISASVTPLDRLTNDLLVTTWPMNVTNTVTNDISIDFAMNVDSNEAVDGARTPGPFVDEMPCPYRG